MSLLIGDEITTLILEPSVFTALYSCIIVSKDDEVSKITTPIKAVYSITACKSKRSVLICVNNRNYHRECKRY